MSLTQHDLILKRIITLIFSLPFALTALTVRYGPLASEFLLPEWFMVWLWPLVGAVTLTGYLLFSVILSPQTDFRFIALFVASGLFLACISVAAGIHIHPDFFGSAFQYSFCMPVIWIYRIWSTSNNHLQKHTSQTIARTGFILAAFYTEWIMLMGYAIVSRTEPRPIEAMIYNVYNVILVIILFISSRQISLRSMNTIEVHENALTINHRDIVSMAGQKKTMLLHAFATAPDRRLRCPEIQKISYPEQENSALDCPGCLSSQTKAALCGRYRTTYNAILDLKKLLDFLEIGTIVASENRRNILTEGWKLILFENVKLVVKKPL